MADPFSDPTQNPNFVNPAYASPQQFAQQRAYANALLANQPPVPGTRGGWTQGIANMVNALVGGHLARQADIQEQAANRAQMQALAGAFGKPNNLSGIIGSLGPMATPAQGLVAGEALRPGGPASTNISGPENVSYSGTAPTGSIYERQFNGGPINGAGNSLPPTMNLPQIGPTPLPPPGMNSEPPQVNNQPTIPATPVGQVKTGSQSPEFAPSSAPKDQAQISTANAGTGIIPPGAAAAIGMKPGQNLTDFGMDIATKKAAQVTAQGVIKDAVAKGTDATPKLDILKQARAISDIMGEGGIIPRFQQRVKDATGLSIGPNAEPNEEFDALMQTLGPNAIKEGLGGLPRGSQLLKQYDELGAKIWQSPALRANFLNNAAIQYDLMKRQGALALEHQRNGIDPTITAQAIYNLPINRKPLEEPAQENLPRKSVPVMGEITPEVLAAAHKKKAEFISKRNQGNSQ